MTNWTNEAKAKQTSDSYTFPVDFEFWLYILLHEKEIIKLLCGEIGQYTKITRFSSKHGNQKVSSITASIKKKMVLNIRGEKYSKMK